MRAVLLGLLSLGVIAVAVAWQAKEGGETKPTLAPSVLKWYKGNLHTHTLWSDGDDFPEMVADNYRKAGYHFLALTEHNLLAEGAKYAKIPEKGPRREALKKYATRFGSDWVQQRFTKGETEVRLKPLTEFRSLLEEPGRFLLIPAEEITDKYGPKPVHMNAINLRDAIKPLGGGNVSETIRANQRAVNEQAKKAGRPILMFLNHPNFGWGVNADDMLAAEELRYFEVYNGHPGVRNDGDKTRPDTERMWDILLALRLGKLKLGAFYGLATDDSHQYHKMAVGQSNPFRGWVMVQAKHLTAEAMVTALEAGQFYGSTGVELNELITTKEELRLKIKPQPGVTYKTQFIATMKDASLESKPGGKDEPRVYGDDIGKVVAEAEGLEASYKPTGKEWYIRARVISSKLHPNPFKKGDLEMAWTQPVVP
ncbi:MAG: hypothetical protein EBV06_09605 [Planctomycetia bacterium]|nr:hypothetical protein [Planctomycetia bacterium]